MKNLSASENCQEESSDYHSQYHSKRRIHYRIHALFVLIGPFGVLSLEGFAFEVSYTLLTLNSLLFRWGGIP